MNEVSLEKAKKTFFTALSIDILVTTVAVLIDFWTVNVLEGFASGGPGPATSTIGYIELFEKFSLVMVLTWLWVGWTLTRWISACYRHAMQTLNVTGLRYEKWKTWGWVIPGLNLFKPFQVLNEIYKAGSSSIGDSRALKTWTFSAPLLIWWIYWVSTHLILVGMSKLVLNQTSVETVTPKQAIGEYYVHIVVCLISLTVAGLWFVVAGSLTSRLQQRGSHPFQASKSTKKAASTQVGDEAFAEALSEIEEHRLDKGVWARSFAESGGDESKAKAAYIKARAKSISDADVWKDTQPPTADNNRAESVQVSRPSGGDDSLPKWVPAFIALVLVAGVVGYQQLNNRPTVAANQVQAPAPSGQSGEKIPKYEYSLFTEGMKEYENKNYAGALAKWQLLADKGYASAQFQLGWMYDQGLGVQQNEAEAVNWYRKAAEQRDAYAQLNLGVMHANGRGVQKNEAVAVNWFRKSAEQGNAIAQFKLGLMYGNGEGIPKDEAEAVNWIRKAAEQGHANAQFSLGVGYANGQVVQLDEVEAVSWFRKAAEQGHVGAQQELQKRGLQ